VARPVAIAVAETPAGAFAAAAAPLGLAPP